MFKNKKFLVIIGIILIYLILKVIVIITPNPNDDTVPDSLLELITDSKISP